jgi:acetamidase/formamidase
MTDGYEPEAAFETLSEGIGRREFLSVAAAIGAGAIAPAWMLSPGVEDAAAATDGPGPRVLQSNRGRRVGHFVESTPQTVQWGFLPNRDTRPIRSVPSGSLVTVDTVSHEGILEDQGRDPVAYFRGKGVSEAQIMRDASAIAASDLQHDFDKDGPHIVTGPIHVLGARAGDVLRVDVVGLVPRAPYGVISNRHGKGALPGEYPLRPRPDPAASAQRPELFHNVSVFTPVRRIRGEFRGVLPVSRRMRAEFPNRPLHGHRRRRPEHLRQGQLDPADCGRRQPRHPRPHRGLDAVPAGVRAGRQVLRRRPALPPRRRRDPLTALEAPLRGTFRLTLLKKGSGAIPGNRGTLDMPFGETAEFWMPVGLNPDLDEAMKQAVREAIEFLHGELGMQRAVAYAYMSAATDYVVSQVVDRTKGVHARISKAHFVDR